MTNAPSVRMQTSGRRQGRPWLAAVASPAMGAAFLSLWFWLLPKWLGFTLELAGAARWRWLAALPSALGFAVALPMGLRPDRARYAGSIRSPQCLVGSASTRDVRNPIYVGDAG
jgi:hypothetical protein